MRTSPTQLRAISVAGLIVVAPMADMGASILVIQYDDALACQTEAGTAEGDPTPPLCPVVDQSALLFSNGPSRLESTTATQPTPRPALSVAPKQSPPA